MVTTVFKKDEAVLLLQLPKANDAMAFNKKPKKGLVIELSLLELALNGQKSNFLKFDKFCEKLKDRDVLIDLRVDKKVPYEKVIKVLNVLQKYKLSNLSLITDY
jgi:biopolymer transport protein ExbD